jgi:SAM-dependent methyltransferase
MAVAASDVPVAKTAQNTGQVQASYDRAAVEYARHYYNELQHKPLDRQLLDRFADLVRGKGPVCDLGCGPGQIADYLRERKIAVCGIDLSPANLAQARRLNPGIEFRQGNMVALDVEDHAWAGIAAFYAIVNFSPADLAPVMREMYRVLQPGGWLLLSFHIGDEIVHVDDLWDCAVSLDFYFFRPEQIVEALQSAGFEIEEIIRRGPYAPEIEYQSQRAYVFARRPPVSKTA